MRPRRRLRHTIDAETTPLRDPEHFQFNFNLPDTAEVWRRGSVISSWLPVRTAALYARLSSRGLADFRNRPLSAIWHGFGGYHEKPAGN